MGWIHRDSSFFAQMTDGISSMTSRISQGSQPGQEYFKVTLLHHTGDPTQNTETKRGTGLISVAPNHKILSS